MVILLLNLGYLLVLGFILGRIHTVETSRSDTLRAENARLLNLMASQFVSVERYVEATGARDRLEDALRTVFVPALQEAATANAKSMTLLQAFQADQARLITLHTQDSHDHD